MDKQVVAIKKKISKLTEQLLYIQQECSHENVVGEMKGDTGNWCQQDDSYWISADCQDCGKHLHIDSKKERDLYRKYSMSGMVK
jgi:hypothetical protein